MNTEKPNPEKLLDEAEGLLEAAEELVEEVIDLEECAKAGRKPPRAKLYRYKVNETLCTWTYETILGRQILEQAGLIPPENYTLREKMSGGPPRRIELDEMVDLRKHGVEKFRAIKKGQHEGEAQGRRGAPVLEQDRLFLDRYGLPRNSSPRVVHGSCCTASLCRRVPITGTSRSRSAWRLAILSPRLT